MTKFTMRMTSDFRKINSISQLITQKVTYIQIKNDSLAKLTLMYNVKKILYDNSIRLSSAYHQILEENMKLAVDRDTQS